MCPREGEVSPGVHSAPSRTESCGTFHTLNYELWQWVQPNAAPTGAVTARGQSGGRFPTSDTSSRELATHALAYTVSLRSLSLTLNITHGRTAAKPIPAAAPTDAERRRLRISWEDGRGEDFSISAAGRMSVSGAGHISISGAGHIAAAHARVRFWPRPRPRPRPRAPASSATLPPRAPLPWPCGPAGAVAGAGAGAAIVAAAGRARAPSPAPAPAPAPAPVPGPAPSTPGPTPAAGGEEGKRERGVGGEKATGHGMDEDRL